MHSLVHRDAGHGVSPHFEHLPQQLKGPHVIPLATLVTEVAVGGPGVGDAPVDLFGVYLRCAAIVILVRLRSSTLRGSREIRASLVVLSVVDVVVLWVRLTDVPDFRDGRDGPLERPRHVSQVDLKDLPEEMHDNALPGGEAVLIQSAIMISPWSLVILVILISSSVVRAISALRRPSVVVIDVISGRTPSQILIMSASEVIATVYLADIFAIMVARAALSASLVMICPVLIVNIVWMKPLVMPLVAAMI
ncbi:hypothetical protein QBC44DRAFT_317951 [Cladorrhinum sp. PSN332]|nr:hypothetical protein QBC44DRAFT_317951 [Cladorrhinum sp. PSN332]